MSLRSTQRKFDALDATFEQLAQRLKTPGLQEELTPERKRARRRKCDDDPDTWLRTYFPEIFDSEPNALHRYLDDVIDNQVPGTHPVRAFRQAGKSARTYMLVIRHIALGRRGLINFSLRNLDKSEARLAALVRLIKGHRLLQYDYEIEIQQDRIGHYIINHTHLFASSYKTGLRSVMDDYFGRITLSIADDLYDATSVTSPTDNERVVQFVDDEIAGQMAPGGVSIVFGNDITHDSPIRILADRHEPRGFVLPILNDEGESNWPERFTVEDIARWQAETDYVVWESQYMLRPAVRGEVFQPEWFRTVNVSTVKILTSISVCDPATGQSTSACDLAVATLGATSSDETVVLDLMVRKCGFTDVFDYVYAHRASWPGWSVLAWENDFAQWSLAERDYRDWQAQTSKTLPIRPFLAKDLGEKLSRIIQLDNPLRTGKMRFSDQITPDGQTGNADFLRFRDQLLAVGASKEKLDGPDALSSAYLLLPGYVMIQEGGLVKSLGKRKFENPRWLGGRGWR